ncbi:hypothetical protein BY996DRAFT_6417797 [Phakopsora pachyrhizi]|nr:hypothetical protein BY996DRAFT_6417797 [Phakopsora pachyrhizi]
MLQDSNSPVGHLPKNIHEIVCIMRPISNPPVSQQMIWANLLFESFHLVARDIIAPATFEPQKVTTDNPLSVECALAGFLASCFSFNKNKSAVLPIKGLKGNEETIKDSSSGTFKNLNDFLDKFIHVLIAINMVQAHAKCQDLPSTSGSFTHPKGKGGVRGLMLGSTNWRKCGAVESMQIIALSNEIFKLKEKDIEEPYWPRTNKYILQIIKNFGDNWHQKLGDSNKKHLSLPKKAQVNAIISKLN